jgi:uncharacterized protein YbbC (DUF1343 family)
MKIKLKTLKDLKKFYPVKTHIMTDMVIVGNVTEEYAKELRKMELVDSIRLKISAIEDIKRLQNEDKEYEENEDFTCVGSDNRNAIEYIKQKFNITNKDLKEYKDED